MESRPLPLSGSYLTTRVQWDYSETLRAAENIFSAYVQESATLTHYVSVTERRAPIRRMDEGQDAFRLPAAGSELVWNTARGRWYRRNGVLLVLEGELWRVILFYLRKGNAYSPIELYDTMIREVEGLDQRDVVQVWHIWQKTGLNRTDFTQGVEWELSGQNELSSPSLSSTRLSSHPREPPSPSLKVWGETTDELARDHNNFKPEFHPDHPRLLKIGTRYIDGTAVWITFLRGEKKASRYFDTNLHLTSVYKLGVEWLPEIQLDVFHGATNRMKEACRRGYLSALINKHLLDTGPLDNDSTLDLIPALRNRFEKGKNEEHPLEIEDNPTVLYSPKQQLTRRTRPLTENQTAETVAGRLRSKTTSKRPVEEPNEELTDNTNLRSSKRRKQQSLLPRGTSQIVLRVSISDKPARAPVNVLFADCGDVDELFDKILTEGSIKESPSTAVCELSATLTSSGRRHLIRRGNASDWDFFYKDVQRAWTAEADLFLHADCEVDILVHTDI